MGSCAAKGRGGGSICRQGAMLAWIRSASLIRWVGCGPADAPCGHCSNEPRTCTTTADCVAGDVCGTANGRGLDCLRASTSAGLRSAKRPPRTRPQLRNRRFGVRRLRLQRRLRDQALRRRPGMAAEGSARACVRLAKPAARATSIARKARSAPSGWVPDSGCPRVRTFVGTKAAWSGPEPTGLRRAGGPQLRRLSGVPATVQARRHGPGWLRWLLRAVPDRTATFSGRTLRCRPCQASSSSRLGEYPHRPGGCAARLFRVTDRGTASYSIPIEVPPGRMGIQPTLSLNYSSSKANGMLGIGWSLGGLSTITRCPEIFDRGGQVQAIQYRSADRFCLDGQALIPVPGTDARRSTGPRSIPSRASSPTG